MDTAIIVALISAVSAIIAAVIAIIPHFLRKHPATPASTAAKPEPLPEPTPDRQLVDPAPQPLVVSRERSSGSLSSVPVGYRPEAQKVVKPVPVVDVTRERQAPPEVDELLSRQEPAVRELIRELRRYLDDSEATVYTVRRNGGEIRHKYNTDNPFSQISFQKDCILLKPRVGRGSVNDPDFVWDRSAYKEDKGTVRLHAGFPIPDKVIRWIERAKRFTRDKYG